MARFEEGQEIAAGRYRLRRRLGAGGMADVWLADDTTLGRPVALKFLHERFAADTQFVERFRREASSAGGLQHANVVGVYDRGEWEDAHYIAMEYVEGASLKDLIERGLSVGEAVEIARQVLAATGFAHSQGIVHRDLKPGNVLVDAAGRAQVTDFGIAKAGPSEITQTGSVLGTAHYLSPEQAQGQEVGPVSDLYSIGVILYEALTGTVPFDGDTAVTIALKQVSEQPKPPSELNPNVSPALDSVVLRALAKDPANRYAGAAEFAAALDAAEAHPGGIGDTASYGAVAGPAGAAAAGALGAAAADAMAAEQAAVQGEGGNGWMTRRRAIVIALVLLLLAAAAVWALTRPGTATVPNVLEDSQMQAEEALEGAGFEAESLLRPFCADANTVVEQDPGAGEQADEGTTVTLTVSTGQEVRVPDVAGDTVREASRRLRRAELLVTVKERFSEDVRPGRATGTRPSRGTEVDCQSEVTLLVSRGANAVTLPSVIGQQRSQAESTLEGLGFVVDVDTEDADAPEGEVIGQNPGPDSRLPEGSTVKIVVSTGAGSVIVPNVEGQSESAARSNLSRRGLSVVVREQTTTRSSEDDRVLEQAPSPGTRVRTGDKVTIVVGVFEPPTTTTATTTTTEP